MTEETKTTVKQFEFPCGCQFELIEEREDGALRVKFFPDINKIALDCTRTWDLISSGNTKGCFQLESRLGQSLASKLKPRNMEHLAALTAIMRPGCVSKSSRIAIGKYKHTKDGRIRFKQESIEDLYKKHQRNHPAYTRSILSYDEKNHCLVENKIVNVMYSGIQPVVKIKYRKTAYNNRCTSHKRSYGLECTLDHPLYVFKKGWTAVQDMKLGDRFLARSVGEGAVRERTLTEHQKTFRDICFRNYEYKCVICDWNNASLDVNHLDGNREVNNHPDNLVFLCPNHHREYTEGCLTQGEIIGSRERHRLPQDDDLIWMVYEGWENAGEVETYDIEVEGPHHNFIANETIVHNCLEAKRDKKSITMHYIDRKNGEEEVTYSHPALESILASTYGEMVFQEQAMMIAQKIAGFDLQQADVLRKAIGKKKPEIMAKVKDEFLQGCSKMGIVDDEKAMELWEQIEKSQRYSFNKSHSVAYAYNCYLSAFIKAHFPRAFFTSYLFFARKKSKTYDEVSDLIANAVHMDIAICKPDLMKRNARFKLYGRDIYYGFSDIKGIGDAMAARMIKGLFKAEEQRGKPVEEFSWSEMLVFLSDKMAKNCMEKSIGAGAMDFTGVSRSKMLHDYGVFRELKDREVEWIVRKYDSLEDQTIEGMFRAILAAPTGTGKDPEKACSSTKRLAKVQSLLNGILNPSYKLIDKPGWLAGTEEQLLGVPLTCNSVEDCDISEANCTCKQFLQERERDPVIIIACKIKQVKEITVKNGKNAGDKMAFLTVEDKTGQVETVTVFSDKWPEVKPLSIERNHVMLQGERGQRKNKESLIVKKMTQI